MSRESIEEKDVIVLGQESFYRWETPYQDGTKDEVDAGTGLRVLQVNSLPSLIQAVGYLKYTLNSEGCDVYYRGQNKLYSTPGIARGKYLFQASALRGVQTDDAAKKSFDRVATKVEILKKMIPPKSLPATCADFQHKDDVLEGLLQQYGFDTAWLDVVDNLWVALWFACFENDKAIRSDSTGRPENARAYYHMVLRECVPEEYAYIILLKSQRSGYALTDSFPLTKTLDLRCELPSIFIRPHVQHGLLLKPSEKSKYNMADLICGIIRINLKDAIKWMGEGRILTAESMVPPPNYDFGFRCLLDAEEICAECKPLKFPIYC